MVDSSGVWRQISIIDLKQSPNAKVWFEYSPARREYRAVLEQSGAVYTYLSNHIELASCAFLAALKLVELKYEVNIEELI